MPHNAVVLDANLLVLLVVGMASPTYISKHKRLQAYKVQDFELLLAYLDKTPRVIVTPNTVTEASNLAGQISEPARTEVFTTLRALLAKTDEKYIASRQAAEKSIFLRLGITDSVVLDAMDANSTLLTSDLDLYLEAAHQGRSAENFNHYIAANG